MTLISLLQFFVYYLKKPPDVCYIGYCFEIIPNITTAAGPTTSTTIPPQTQTEAGKVGFFLAGIHRNCEFFWSTKGTVSLHRTSDQPWNERSRRTSGPQKRGEKTSSDRPRTLTRRPNRLPPRDKKSMIGLGHPTQPIKLYFTDYLATSTHFRSRTMIVEKEIHLISPQYSLDQQHEVALEKDTTCNERIEKRIDFLSKL